MGKFLVKILKDKESLQELREQLDTSLETEPKDYPAMIILHTTPVDNEHMYYEFLYISAEEMLSLLNMKVEDFLEFKGE